MQNLVRSETVGVTGNGGRGTAGAGPGRDLLYMYPFLMESLSVDYTSSLALSTQMTKLRTTPSSCRPVWRKWRTPSTSPH